MLIKASRITNLTDARYFAAKEVDFLGFNLEDGAEGFLDPLYMKAIREWVAGPQIVGEFDRTPASTVLEAAAFYGLDAVQVTRTDELAALGGLTVILSVPAAAGYQEVDRVFREAAPYVRYFLLDFTAVPETAAVLLEQAGAWQQLFVQYPALLHLDLPAAGIAAVLKVLTPAGLAFRGGDEERVGIKSFDEIDAVFETLGLG